MNHAPKNKRRVVLIEPSAIVAAGLRSILSDTGSEFEVCGSFEEPGQFLERAPLLEAEVIVVDPVVFDFPKRAMLHTYFEQQPDVVWVALVHGFMEPDVLRQFHGAIYLYDDGHKIIRQLRQALEERQQNNESATDSYELTDRESEILVSVARGMTNKEIAEAHHISVHTVISHRKNITRKTGIKTVSGLTVYALLNNLIDQSDIE